MRMFEYSRPTLLSVQILGNFRRIVKSLRVGTVLSSSPHTLSKRLKLTLGQAPDLFSYNTIFQVLICIRENTYIQSKAPAGRRIQNNRGPKELKASTLTCSFFHQLTYGLTARLQIRTSSIRPEKNVLGCKGSPQPIYKPLPGLCNPFCMSSATTAPST